MPSLVDCHSTGVSEASDDSSGIYIASSFLRATTMNGLPLMCWSHTLMCSWYLPLYMSGLVVQLVPSSVSGPAVNLAGVSILPYSETT